MKLSIEESVMSEATSNTSQLKELIKAAIVEILTEQKELFTDILIEAMEEIALVKAIEAGETTELVDRSVIFQLLSQQS
jgi:predicted HTH domain antitoxin